MHEHHDIDWDAMTAQLEREAEVHASALTRATAWVRDLAGPNVERVLDVGSGPGVITGTLARVFEQANVVAVDQSDQLLERALAHAASERLSDRVSTLRVDLPADFAELGEVDVIWTSKVVHHLGDQSAGVTQLASRLRDGGLLAVVEGGLPPRFLPRDIGMGRPGLAARLDVAWDEAFCRMRAELPDSVPIVEDWPSLLATAGLIPTGSHTFLTDRPAPLDDVARQHVYERLARLREQADDVLDAEDLTTLDELLRTDAPTGVLRRPDMFYLSALTVHTGRAFHG